MQTIGEKLEEARKRRGISIREASEVTKIRSEYLANFENNSFDLNVPDVYIRGFLRAYAEFLKLNGEKIITDFNAHQLGESTFVRQKESRESLGRMDIPAESNQGGEGTPSPAGIPQPSEPSANPQNDEGRFNYNNFDKATLIKVGGPIAGAAVLVIVIVIGLVAIFRSGPEETATATTTEAPAAAQELTLLANGGNILSITATEVGTGRQIFRGPLNEGDKHRIPFDEQVELRFTNAEYLGLEANGRTLRMGEARGPGRIIYPPPGR